VGHATMSIKMHFVAHMYACVYACMHACASLFVIMCSWVRTSGTGTRDDKRQNVWCVAPCMYAYIYICMNARACVSVRKHLCVCVRAVDCGARNKQHDSAAQGQHGAGSRVANAHSQRHKVGHGRDPDAPRRKRHSLPRR